MRVLFNTSRNLLYVTEAESMGFDEYHNVFIIRLSGGTRELMNNSLSRPQADDLCRSALITGTADLTPYGRTYFDTEYTKDKRVIGSEPNQSLW